MCSVLIGNYGVGNVGDEALKDYFLRTFPEVEWIVLSVSPGRQTVPRLPLGIRSFFTTPWWRTLRALRSADAVVFGGGTLFTDCESVNACALWGIHALVGRWLGKPVIFAFQGIGPLQTRLGRWCATLALRNAAFFSVRDKESEREARQLGLGIETVLTFDPVFALFEQRDEKSRAPEVLTIVPRHNSPLAFDVFVREQMQNHKGPIEILSLQPEDPEEKQVCERLRQGCGEFATIIPMRTLPEVREALARSALLITQRYHAAIPGLAMGIPMRILPMKAGDKLDAIRRIQEQPGARASLRQAVLRGEEALRTALRATMPAHARFPSTRAPGSTDEAR